jgi:hypothetical protein
VADFGNRFGGPKRVGLGPLELGWIVRMSEYMWESFHGSGSWIRVRMVRQKRETQTAFCGRLWGEVAGVRAGWLAGCRAARASQGCGKSGTRPLGFRGAGNAFSRFPGVSDGVFQ